MHSYGSLQRRFYFNGKNGDKTTSTQDLQPIQIGNYKNWRGQERTIRTLTNSENPKNRTEEEEGGRLTGDKDRRWCTGALWSGQGDSAA